MIEYDNSFSLIHIHIPKTAGTSVRESFSRWFGEKLLLHYYVEVSAEMPIKFDLNSLHSSESPVCLLGHFNKTRGFGVEDYYPEICQFTTILRDPLEMELSGYFFVNRVSKNWKDKSRLPQGDLSDYIRNVQASMLNFFPREITIDNYKEIIETMFIEVGVTEHLGESMMRIANKLGREFDPGVLPQLNVTERDEFISAELRDEFIHRHELEYAVYNYVLSRYE